MERVAEGGAHARYTPQMWGFEINAIGLEFNSALDRLLMHQQEAEKERIHREKLAQELKLGHDMQANLLPKVIPQIHHLKLAAGYLPAKEVSGDFYDVFPLPSGRMLLLVADIAGKGIPACLFSLGLRSSIRALASTTHDLSLLVEKANELFLHDAQESGMFATVWIAILDKNTLHYLNLGHPPALLKRHREIRELSTGHPALGLMKYESLKTHSIQLEPGDELLLYSDGVTEAHHADNELYGLRRLKDSFLRSRFGSSLDSILEEIELFSQNHPQKDDLTLLRLSKEMEV
jgi:sigma-B regulation protein RsbU (phosphoserine phosphatase)